MKVWFTRCTNGHVYPSAKAMDKRMKTKRVRIAVAIDENGEYHAVGFSPGVWRGEVTDEDMRIDALDAHGLSKNAAVVFVEADIPLPQEQTVVGEIKQEDH